MLTSTPEKMTKERDHLGKDHDNPRKYESISIPEYVPVSALLPGALGGNVTKGTPIGGGNAVDKEVKDDGAATSGYEDSGFLDQDISPESRMIRRNNTPESDYCEDENTKNTAIVI